jgi:hypothetical protein
MFRTSSARQRSLTTAVLVLALLLGATALASAAAWQGQMTQEDGVTMVSNPKTGVEAPVTVKLDELWRIGGDTDNDDEFFGVIGRVIADKDGNVYLLDNQLSEVKVFSPDGEYLRTIGREGEGPGEFRRPQDMFFLPDGNLGVLQLAPGRIIMFTLDGEPLGDYPLPKGDDGATPVLVGGQRMGKNLILVLNENKLGEGKIDITRSLAVIDPNGKELQRLHSETRTLDFANAVFDEKTWSTFDRRWAVGPDGRLFAVTQFPDYEIVVWGPDGKKQRVITREYEHLARTQEEMDRVKSIFEVFTRQVPNAQVKVSSDDQDIQTVYPRADGTLWVLGARGARNLADGVLGTFDVFDAEGRFQRQVTLQGQGNPLQDGYFFVGDRLYVVTGFLDAAMAAAGGGDEDADMDEAEPMAVICYQVGPLKAGM